MLEPRTNHEDPLSQGLRAEAALRANGDLLAQLAALVPGLVYLFDLDERRSVFVNHQARMVLGYGEDEIIALGPQFIPRVLHPDDGPRLERHFERLATLADGETAEIEYRFQHRNGAWRWFLSRDRAFERDSEGRVRLVLGIATDVTERRLTEEQARQSELRLRLALDAAYLISFEWDIPRNEVRRLHSTDPTLAATRDEAPSTFEAVRDAVHPEDRALFEAKVRAAMDDPEGRYESEFRLLRADGSIAWLFERGRIERDAEGHPLRLIGLSQDITERKRGEEELRLSRDRLQFVLSVTGIGLWLNTMPLGRLTWDQRTRELFFLPPDVEPTIDLFWSRLHPDDREPTRLAVEAALRDHSLYTIEHRTVDPQTGAVRWVRSMGQATYGEDGAPILFDGINYDITDRKLAEQGLREADRHKDEFLATLAHEMRNPLAPIRNAVEVLRLKDSGDATLQAARDVIDRQLQHMVRLVDDLLDLSRISRGKLELRKEPVTLTAVIEQAIETSRPHLEAAGHRLTVTLPPDPIRLVADPVRLAQVFANLINNACKYSEASGAIRVRAAREGVHAVVVVEDDGIGIPAEALPRLFEMFSQAHPALEHTQSGLGIGLALVRGLVEMHGGSIEAHSEGPGRGSAFVVRLPIPSQHAAVEAPQPHGKESSRSTARRILVVDDNIDSAESLAMLLELSGHHVHIAHDGAEALAVAERARPDVVLLDLGMPQMNGYQVCEQIRAQPWGKTMLLIAQTGWGTDEDRRRTREAGFDDHLVKPVDYTAVLALLAAAP